ncbi:RimJ/RimL family protein N-acetyltransferase [Chitinophaga polysaccharea]|uniref:RimJ/RimL family protein N-acetyltransferase n=1 Tax=Chitinophaga polysaccharea TaxID=1293035 RepID=A0A561Q4J1_9BACT|nr:GNAT family N-acetyltransferase [Chitinophaga polysaccharea]TWF45293.1 RimJ/RimL family protein N-acetyltransferase [Chitinophaga polysaccharea]
MKTIATLTGKNDVKLKAIERSDLEDMAVLANDPAVAANLRDTFPSPYSLKDAEEFLSLIEQGKLNHVWGIYAKDKIAGAITLTPQTDIYRHSAEIGYWLGAPFHGKGIMTEAVSLLTEYAFREMNILRIYAGVFAYNEDSQKVLMKSGYHLEAVKVKAVIKNDVLHDEHLMVRMNI